MEIHLLHCIELFALFRFSLYFGQSGRLTKDLTVYAEGELVVAKFEADGKWYRGRVVDCEPELERVKVFFVDYGNSEWVKEHYVRPMEARFMHLPFQAVECFLNIEPVNSSGWTKSARKSFSELAEGKLLIGQILHKWVPSGHWLVSLCGIASVCTSYLFLTGLLMWWQLSSLMPLRALTSTQVLLILRVSNRRWSIWVMLAGETCCESRGLAVCPPPEVPQSLRDLDKHPMRNLRVVLPIKTSQTEYLILCYP